MFVGVLFLTPSAFAADRTDRTVYVHLFEWTWKDIALECENFLGPRGYAAVQVSPPNEHAVLPNYPWYQRYQPVSYEIISRSGTRDEFIDMVARCRRVGVGIYVDAVINHMTWANRSGQTKYGISGTPYDLYRYGNLYGPGDFHQCGRNSDNTISNYQDRWEVQNCDLATCTDLRTENEYVRNQIAAYLNDLLDIGVAGFRIDAAKHMPASDLQAIFSKLRRPFYDFQEVIDLGGEPIQASEYFATGDTSEFRYGRALANAFLRGQIAWLDRFGADWGFVPSNKAVVFTDNHDNQRGHGAGGEVLTFRDGNLYALANIFMLAWPYGYPQVMSSYQFSTDSQGPPTGPGPQTRRVYRNNSVDCGKDWICEHRWLPIANMVGFRNYVGSSPVQKWWTDGDNVIAFARGTRGYVIINRESSSLSRWFDTGLPGGEYCDITSGDYNAATRSCSGPIIRVETNGWAKIQVPPMRATALHGGAMRPLNNRSTSPDNPGGMGAAGR